MLHIYTAKILTNKNQPLSATLIREPITMQTIQHIWISVKSWLFLFMNSKWIQISSLPNSIYSSPSRFTQLHENCTQQQ